jgi:hypothetical protein
VFNAAGHAIDLEGLIGLEDAEGPCANAGQGLPTHEDDSGNDANPLDRLGHPVASRPRSRHRKPPRVPSRCLRRIGAIDDAALISQVSRTRMNAGRETRFSVARIRPTFVGLMGRMRISPWSTVISSNVFSSIPIRPGSTFR